MSEDCTFDDIFVDAIDVIGQRIVDVNRENGWNVATPECWDEQYKVPAVIALIHSEASEALEVFRKSRDLQEFNEEMADIFIRVVDLTHGLGLDLGDAILKKLEKNRHRGYRHGGKKV